MPHIATLMYNNESNINALRKESMPPLGSDRQEAWEDVGIVGLPRLSRLRDTHRKARRRLVTSLSGR